jgi:hypothetical protein
VVRSRRWLPEEAVARLAAPTNGNCNYLGSPATHRSGEKQLVMDGRCPACRRQSRPFVPRRSRMVPAGNVRTWPDGSAPSVDFIATLPTANLHHQRQLYSRQSENFYHSCQSEAAVRAGNPNDSRWREQPMTVGCADTIQDLSPVSTPRPARRLDTRRSPTHVDGATTWVPCRFSRAAAKSGV